MPTAAETPSWLRSVRREPRRATGRVLRRGLGCTRAQVRGWISAGSQRSRDLVSSLTCWGRMFDAVRLVFLKTVIQRDENAIFRTKAGPWPAKAQKTVGQSRQIARRLARFRYACWSALGLSDAWRRTSCNWRPAVVNGFGPACLECCLTCKVRKKSSAA